MSRNTGQMTQARTSYLSREILWGYRFTEIVNYDEDLESYVADYDKLDEVVQISSCAFVNQSLFNYDEESSDDDDRGIRMVNLFNV